MDEDDKISPWKVIPKDEIIKKVRMHFKVPTTMTDDEIAEIGEMLFSILAYNFQVVVGNEIELREIRKDFTRLAEHKRYDQYIIAEPDKFLAMTERLFNDGFYLLACIGGRFTLERFLHYELMETVEFGPNIKDKRRNPNIQKMIDFIANRDTWDPDFKKKVEQIKDHGDWQAHHRFDMIFEGMTDKDFLWAVVRATTGFEGLKTEYDEWSTFVENRDEKSRDYAFLSLKYLHELFYEYRKDLVPGE